MNERSEKIILTGDRPTGKLHLGHLAGSLLNRVKLQNEGYRQFVMIADVQALTDNADNPQKVRENVIEVMLDNLAVGVDPKKTTFFIQSEIPQIAELTIYFLNLVTLARLKRNPTVKDEMEQKGYGETVPVGFLAYPVSQAADILSVGATLIPVGKDQLPMVEQTNEIVRKFNSYYGETFEEIKALVSDTPRLRGIDGKAKMSKSLGNCIYLSDSNDEIREKVTRMYTDPLHIDKNTPGHVEDNVVFEYLDAFYNDKKELQELKERYQRGGVGDVEVKERLAAVLEETIAPIRKKREELARYISTMSVGGYTVPTHDEIDVYLSKGSEEVRAIAERTLYRAKVAMRIHY